MGFCEAEQRFGRWRPHTVTSIASPPRPPSRGGLESTQRMHIRRPSPSEGGTRHNLCAILDRGHHRTPGLQPNPRQPSGIEQGWPARIDPGKMFGDRRWERGPAPATPPRWPEHLQTVRRRPIHLATVSGWLVAPRGPGPTRTAPRTNATDGAGPMPRAAHRFARPTPPQGWLLRPEERSMKAAQGAAPLVVLRRGPGPGLRHRRWSTHLQARGGVPSEPPRSSTRLPKRLAQHVHRTRPDGRSGA